MAGDKKVREEMQSSQALVGCSSSADTGHPSSRISHAAEWRLWFFFLSFFLFFKLRFATYLGTLTLYPHLPSCSARLKDRQPHQSAGSPKKLSPPLSPVLGPGWLLCSPAGPAQRMPSASTVAIVGQC